MGLKYDSTLNNKISIDNLPRGYKLNNKSFKNMETISDLGLKERNRMTFEIQIFPDSVRVRELIDGDWSEENVNPGDKPFKLKNGVTVTFKR